MDSIEIKKDFPILQNRNITYLDSGATTQKPIQVIKAVEEFYEKYNHLPRPIVKSANNRLLDGFLVLLFAKENQIEQIPCIKIENVWDIS